MEVQEYLINKEPLYLGTGDEIEVYTKAFENKLPILLKGPTGCGKTRFIEYMAWRLKKPLITVSCHDDLSTSDLVGRYLLKDNETAWIDGPLTRAVRYGCICYLDEIVEARKDTTVVIHPLCDDRRLLAIEKRGELINADENFCMTVSYNPGYQSVLKNLKQSTRQRFVAIEFNYPKAEIEQEILCKETSIDSKAAENLVRFANMTRNLKDNGLDEGASTRLLVHTAKLIAAGIAAPAAVQHCISLALSDDPNILRSLEELSSSVF
ncbi:MAG: CbbQ/NirQ/NorQ/GpvN family protein [Chromatiales bacterium]|nr:CbbQ/NirQ/NorQ/GpvN family protein [Chromatiales bacterium]